MNVQMICALGGFDRIFVDGTTNTMPASGITINNNDSFLECLNNDPMIHEHSITRLRINIIGEIIESSDIDEVRQYKKALEHDGVKAMQTGIVSRYCIGYANIILLKGNEYFMTEESFSKSKNEQSMEIIGKKGDESGLLVAALRLGNHIVNTVRNEYDDATIAVIDRIFVHRKFRHLGISTWIHDNVCDIIHTYSLCRPNATLLAYADFTNEAAYLNITQDDYLDTLHKHYVDRGYLEFSKLFRLKDGIDARRIMYKLYDTKI